MVKPEQWKKYKAELFGTDTEVFAPEHYNQIAVIKALEVDYQVWETYPIDLKARLIAQLQLSTLVEIVRRHDKIQSDKDAKRQAEIDAKNKAPKPKAGKGKKSGRR